MKTFAKRLPGERPYRGYVARCRDCGEMVVHAESTQRPFHMHARSKKCADARLALNPTPAPRST